MQPSTDLIPIDVDSPPLPSGASQLPTTIACLVRPVPSITPDLTVDAVGALFRRMRRLHDLPVVQSGIPVGLVRRMDFMDIYLSQYGRDLYSRKPIALFMDARPTILENSTLLEDASRVITARADRHASSQAFIITQERRYLGLAWTMDLLEKITDLRVHCARYANPLTLLPGNVPIQEHIERLLQSQRPFAVAYCDLDHFKPYNDVYGYKRGDQVIQRLGRILVECAAPEVDFVGHIGGDDFIVVFENADWPERCARILAVFAQDVPRFYSEQDRAQGGILAQDRSARSQFFPLLSLSIGAVVPDHARCRSHHDIATLATDAKHQAKQIAGNSLFVDRRQGILNLPPAIAAT